jgi:FkbM family methyltransferase
MESIDKLFLQKLKVKKMKMMPRMQPGVFRFANLIINYTDPLSIYYEYKDIFENEIYGFAAEKPNPVIIDAGGCIGMSVLFFKQHYPEAKIIVFEPDPNIFLTLEKNIIQNKVNNVTLINSGLGKSEGTALFYPDGSDGGSTKIKQGITPLEVRIEQLSKYINGPVDFLKMNIEGMEGEVFEEIEHKLNLINEMVFEYHAFANLPQGLGKILDILDRNGFKYVVTDATNAKVPVPFRISTDYKYFNLVYAKKMSDRWKWELN